MWFGREGRHGVCMVAFSCCDFQILAVTTIIFMYSFHKQLFNHDQVNTFSNLKRKKQEEKKTIKKLVKTF